VPNQVVSISDMKISDREDDAIITYSLGSCIGMAVYDPVRKIGGMLHYMLPASKIAPAKAEANPAMFADTGVPMLLNYLLQSGAQKSRLLIKVAGGAQLMDDNKVFNIGERNFLMLRKLLWANNLLLKGQHVGGAVARTLRLEIATGRVTVKFAGTEVEL
jgi:chemotaxis protein CheD